MAKKQMSIVLEDGTVDEAELLFAFEFNFVFRSYFNCSFFYKVISLHQRTDSVCL